MFSRSLVFAIFSFSFFSSFEGKPEKLARIFQGVSTPIKIVPYQAVIFQPGLCGGSILSSKWIVTAAHCTENRLATEIQFGVGIQNTNDKSSFELNRVIDIAQHPDYDTRTLDNDIALLKSAKEIVFTSTIQPIKLGETVPPDNAMVTVSGYGKTEFNGNYSNDLLSADLYIVENNFCNYFHGFRVSNNMICAANEGDACQGDSGGPLTYNGTLVGIVSFGKECGLNGVPGVYTKVANFITWITDTMKV